MNTYEQNESLEMQNFLGPLFKIFLSFSPAWNDDETVSKNSLKYTLRSKQDEVNFIQSLMFLKKISEN